MRVGVPRETTPGERRVALVPETVGKLAAAGFELVVEPGAGDAASFPDDAYADAGATLGDPWDADGVVKVRKPSAEELGRLRDGQLLIGFLEPLADPRGIERARGARRDRVRDGVDPAHHARAVDGRALVAGDGRRLQGGAARGRAPAALLPDADDRRRHRPAREGARDRRGRRRAAGDRDRAPARRRRRPASTSVPSSASRSRASARTGSTSASTGAEAEGGYARELTPEEMEAQQQALEERIADFDVVITTAAVPGRPAPKIIPASAVEAMRPGSVIVDLAAETGGNCELTEPGEIVERDGVTLVGLTNLPSTMPYHASTLYSRNVQALLLHLAPEGELALDWSDEITSGACVAGKQEVAA